MNKQWIPDSLSVIMAGLVFIGCMVAVVKMSENSDKVDIEKEKTHQLELQVELEKAKNK